MPEIARELFQESPFPVSKSCFPVNYVLQLNHYKPRPAMIYGEVTDPWAGEVGAASATANQETSDVPADDDLQCWHVAGDLLTAPSMATTTPRNNSSFAILPAASASSRVAIGGPSSRKMVSPPGLFVAYAALIELCRVLPLLTCDRFVAGLLPY